MSARTVLLVCEAGQGQNEAVNPKLLATGAAIARHWGGKLVCVLAGNGIAAQAADLARYADEVLLADHARHANYDPQLHLKLVQSAIASHTPGAVLMGHTYIGMDLAARLGARIGSGVATNCSDIEIDGANLYFVRPVHRSRLHAKVAVEGDPMVATLQAGTSSPEPAATPGAVQPMTVEPDAGARLRPLRTIEPDRSGVDITKADIVVSGGRGVGAKENYELVNALAEALGGVSACSRPLVDMGWFTVTRQVGLSGNTVKPKLYVACGISGAIEHLHGMRESGCIVAINKDAEAPIFRVAHCGLIGDLNEIVPALTAEVRAQRPRK